jgi:hypothetical protein
MPKDRPKSGRCVEEWQEWLAPEIETLRLLTGPRSHSHRMLFNLEQVVAGYLASLASNEPLRGIELGNGIQSRIDAARIG